MKVDCKIYLQNDEGTKFFGKGPMMLLEKVETYGSLNRAAKEMDMAYSKAFRLMKDAEAAFGFPLLERTTGGVSGGGSRLTPEAKEWVAKYATLEKRIKAYAEDAYNDIF